VHFLKPLCLLLTLADEEVERIARTVDGAAVVMPAVHRAVTILIAAGNAWEAKSTNSIADGLLEEDESLIIVLADGVGRTCTSDTDSPYLRDQG